MDIAAEARILTLASTNDAATLDKAAIRTGRFDAIDEVGYPTRTDAACILTALITNLLGADTVDRHAVVAALSHTPPAATCAKSSVERSFPPTKPGNSVHRRCSPRWGADVTAPTSQKACASDRDQ